MSDRIFYAAAEDQNVKGKINSYVPSKFLVRNGMYVVDPVPGASQKATSTPTVQEPVKRTEK